jgi:hypothetical protein
MKVFFQSADDKSRIDGSIQCNLLNHFPEIVTSLAAADLVILPISFFHDYKFNPKIYDIAEAGKPYVFMDWLEYEWCYFNEKNETHLFGKNTLDCRWLNPNWHPLHEWMRNHPPLVYFKRELLANDVSDTVKPIEWQCYLADMPMQSEDEFNARPLEVFFNWGFSNPMRPTLHSKIFEAMNHGIGVISEASQFEPFIRDHPHARAWMTVFAPWFSRVSITDLLFYQRRAKLSVSLPGCGVKCFRHAESPCESIMALPEDDLAWGIPWVHEDNCIRLRPDRVFEDLNAATKRGDLYQIYKRSQETIARYRGPAYVRDYLLPIIEAHLPNLAESTDNQPTK